MSLKTKLAVGIMSGALGLSLVGGGTWAAFNDVETVTNSFAAGTLDLGKGDATNVFEVSNLKPGDSIERTLTLSNNGTLDINKVFLNATSVEGWVDKDILKLPNNKGKNTLEQFLSQFTVEISNGSTVVYGANGSKTLLNLKNEATNNNGSGVEIGSNWSPGASSSYKFKVVFKNDDTLIPGTRLHEQNKYQGEAANFKFVFEATQKAGQAR